MTTMKMATTTVRAMKTRMRTKSRRLSLVPSATSLGACSFFGFIRYLGKLSRILTPHYIHAVRKTTTTKSAPMNPKSRQREIDRGQDDEDGSGASEPADSIMDSGSEEEADNEVDGMLGE
jgi:hypothetical protein